MVRAPYLPRPLVLTISSSSQDNSIKGFGNHNNISNGKIGGVHSATTVNGGDRTDLMGLPNATQVDSTFHPNVKDNSIQGFGDYNNISGGKIGGVHSDTTINGDGSAKDKEIIAALQAQLKTAQDQLKQSQDKADAAAKDATAKIKELDAELKKHGNCDVGLFLAEKRDLLTKIKAAHFASDAAEAKAEAAEKIKEAQDALDKQKKDVSPAFSIRVMPRLPFAQAAAILEAARIAANDLERKVAELRTIISSGGTRPRHEEGSHPRQDEGAPGVPAGTYNVRNRSTGSDLTLYEGYNRPTCPVTVFYPPAGTLRNRVIHFSRDDSGRPLLSHVEPAFWRASRYIHAGPVFAEGQSPLRLIPAKQWPGFYFISTDLASNPPSVVVDSNPHGSRGGHLHMAPLNETDERQMWQFLPPA
ncbi:hypothetical protein DFH08DRAFT_1011565 [Mycena albidolilacea]|uniref:Uncharacterized protein n=1 Tax=Mycena albidolilacea TaxID=1033008 RepID=A0AAD6ZWI4_9AGAR|nr:hypothetical protein DFH08DRAFT_1011565 [Mycena albidolilacea]